MSERPLNVLVLGVGGNVSQGILKALATSDLPCRVVGACISPDSAGLYWTDKAYISPFANAPEFVDWLLETCQQEHIDVILTGVEPILQVLAANEGRIREQGGARCIVSRAEVLAIAGDKWRTADWLRAQGLNYPAFAAADDPAALDALVAAVGFPLLAKPRAGKGSSGIVKLDGAAELDAVRGDAEMVVQQYLGTPNDEYTASCFSDKDGAVRGCIVMRRTLQHGTTVQSEVGLFPVVRAEAERIAAALRPVGPCNIQLRLHEGVPVCFEINARFSGTTPMRAHFGFNDVEAALRHYVLGEAAVDLPLVTQGMALRYWNEVYIDPADYARLSQQGRTNAPNQSSTIEMHGGRE